jgi:ribosomal protein L12E/L44/L45/RPP1/RPP2
LTSTGDSLVAAAAAAAAAAASVWRSNAAAEDVGTGDDVTEMKESQESDESSDVST